jgi:Acetyltransferases, including N-acetylases of ribosomal proteins
VLAFIDRKTDLHIGNVGLHAIDGLHRTAVLGIVIGEKSAWGRGIGRKSWRAITDYGFGVLNLHKICATVIEGNEASLKCALSAGYLVDGRQAQQIFKNGKYLDLIHVGLLRQNWKE